MVKLSVQISDAIAPDFEGKLRAAAALGIHNVEADGAFDGVPLQDMTGAQLERIRSLLIDWNMRLVLVSAGIPASDREALKRLFRRALTLDVEAIRLDPGTGEDADFARRLAESYSIALCVENAAEGPWPDEVRLLEAVKGVGAKVIFNPLEIVRTERHPFFHAFYNSRIKNDIRFLRVCDGLYRTHEPVRLGHGCAEV